MSRPVTADNLDIVRDGYKYGFVTDIESDTAPPGLNEEIVRFISAKKGEPEWLLDWRLNAYRHWQTMEEPHWAKLNVAPIDYQGADLLLRAQAPERAEIARRGRSRAAEDL